MNREDILNSLGLQSIPDRSDSVLPAMGIFGAGILVGAGLGMLFAPKPGRELRADLAKNAEGLTDTLKSRAEDLKNRLPDVGGMIQNAGGAIQNAIGGGSDDDAQKQGGQGAQGAKRSGDARAPQH